MYVNIDNSKRPSDKDDEYNSVIKQIQQDGVCPFCTDQLLKYHKKPIITETNNWYLTENMYPYDGTKEHLLLISKTHIEHLTELSTEAWLELQTLITSELKKRQIAGGTMFIRFGETKYTGASVNHLHVQLISRDLTYPEDKPILTRIG